MPVMVQDEKLTVVPLLMYGELLMYTPPPNPIAAVLPVMVHDEKLTAPPLM